METERKFIFNNWTSEDFTWSWDSNMRTFAVGSTTELPAYLAEHFAKHLIDREMNRDGKSTLMGIENERKAYLDKTITEISAGTDSPALSSLKEKLRAEIEAEKVESVTGDMLVKKAPVKKGKTIEVEEKATTEEFADLK